MDAVWNEGYSEHNWKQTRSKDAYMYNKGDGTYGQVEVYNQQAVWRENYDVIHERESSAKER